MSEQNILNPAQTSLFNPDWGYTEGLPEMRSLFQSQSGKMYARRQMGRGRAYDLAWNNRDLATKHTLQQWAQQYENDFFTFADWERSRYFSGRFEGPLTFSPAGNQKYNIRGRFIELPGPFMFSYPSNWTRDAMFLEERNGFGEDLVKLAAPTAILDTFSNAHGGSAYRLSATNDTAEWVYFGYGFRLWHNKDTNQGIVEVKTTRVRDGVTLGSVDTVDTYAAVPTAAAPLYAVQGLNPLDFYRVRLRNTGTKNASSSNTIVYADAIEVMQ
jgi:hypothetical protein